MVRIAHASKDENGRYTNGTAGDQTGQEVCIRDWYNRPWNVIIRAKDPNIAEKIAEAMESAVKNDKIGYDQNNRNSLLTEARPYGYNPAKVTKACETDCSALVALACMYAGIPESALVENGNSAYTGNLKRKLTATGKFECLTASKYRTSDKYLKRGDILLYEGHHVAVSLDNGSEVSSNAPESTGTASKVYNIESAAKFDIGVAGNYTASTDLNLRTGAGTNKTKILVIPKGGKVTCYGYYTLKDSTKWLLVKYGMQTGFCSAKYLIKR